MLLSSYLLPAVTNGNSMSPTQSSQAAPSTLRDALAVARSAYGSLLVRTLAAAEDHPTRNVAAKSFDRGMAALVAMEATASDLALSPHASDALAQYLASLETQDVDAALVWLGLFPEVMRDIERDALIQVVQVRAAGPAGEYRGLVPDRLSGLGDFRESPRRQPALALAA